MKKLLLILLPLLLLNTIGLSQNQNNLRNKYRLAQSYERSGNYEKAGSIYKELLKAQPWNFQYLQGLNNIFIIQKKYEESISLLNERLKTNNRDLNSYGLLGSTYYISGDYERAYETWQKGIDVNPASLTSYRTIANYAIENRAFDKAVEYLNEAKTVSKKKSTYAFDLAQIFSITMKFGGGRNRILLYPSRKSAASIADSVENRPIFKQRGRAGKNYKSCEEIL